MYPRLKLDIEWRNLAYAAGQCFVPRNRLKQQQRLEGHWSPGGDGLACLSVRSGFDLALRACNFPRGSEVAMSAVTIRDMARIVEDHGLVPVPVDIDPLTLAPRWDALRQAVNDKTVAIVIAHLFGSRSDLGPAAELAAARGLMLFEDCAQAFTADDYRGHPGADVSMFSFGPIKTATALGGALLRVQDPQLLDRLRQAQATYPLQSRWLFLRRVAKFSFLKLLSTPWLYTALSKGCRAICINPDTLVNRSVKGFPGPNFFGRIRRQPSSPLLALVRRRLETYGPERVERRATVAERVRRGLRQAWVRLPGLSAEFHSHWVVPICVRDPQKLIVELRARGFDATMAASNMVALPAPADRAQSAAVDAENMLADFVYLPAYPGIPAAALERLVEVIHAWSLGHPVQPAEPPAAVAADQLVLS